MIESIGESTVPSDGVAVEASIDIGGGEALGLAADSGHVWAVAFESSSLVSVDPTTNQVSATVDLDDGAASALAVDEQIWVVAYAMAGGSSLTRVDGHTAEVAGTFPTDELCCDLSSDDRGLWAIDPNGAALRFDLETGELIDRYDIDVDRNVHVNGVHAGDAYWYASDTTQLSRLDPATGTIDAFVVGGGVPFLARDGLLWGATATDVWAVDDATGQVVETIAVPDSIEVISMEVTADDVFVGMRHPGRRGAVLQLDRATGAEIAEIDVDIPARIVIAFGSVWVTDSGGSLVYRLGPVET
jgi:streptogramin lyase